MYQDEVEQLVRMSLWYRLVSGYYSLLDELDVTFFLSISSRLDSPRPNSIYLCVVPMNVGPYTIRISLYWSNYLCHATENSADQNAWKLLYTRFFPTLPSVYYSNALHYFIKYLPWNNKMKLLYTYATSVLTHQFKILKRIVSFALFAELGRFFSFLGSCSLWKLDAD